MNDLVFIMANSRLNNPKRQSSNDLSFDDVLSDDEWIVEDAYEENLNEHEEIAAINEEDLDLDFDIDLEQLAAQIGGEDLQIEGDEEASLSDADLDIPLNDLF